MTTDEFSARAFVFQALVLLEEAVPMVLREADHPSQLAEIAEAAGILDKRTGGAGRNGSRKESSIALRNRDSCGRFRTGSVDRRLRLSSLFRRQPLMLSI